MQFDSNQPNIGGRPTRPEQTNEIPQTYREKQLHKLFRQTDLEDQKNNQTKCAPNDEHCLRMQKSKGVTTPIRALMTQTDSTDHVRTAILLYFGDLPMHFYRQESIFKVYIAKLSSLQLKQQRYILVFVPDSSIDQDRSPKILSQLRWTSCHTRELSLNENYFSHNYPAVSNALLRDIITKTDEDKDGNTNYTSKYVKKVMLLKPKESYKNYPNSGTIATALETFNCVIYL
jgi:hypothetical protein